MSERFRKEIFYVKDVRQLKTPELMIVVTAKSGSVMLSNALILHGIRRRRDVTDLSEERRGFLIKAVRAAETIVHMCLKSQTVRHDHVRLLKKVSKNIPIWKCIYSCFRCFRFEIFDKNDELGTRGSRC